MSNSRSRVRKVGSARVEVGNFSHEGKSYSALGSAVDHDRGVVVGYPKNGVLQSWDGKPIGTCRIVSRWKNKRGIFSSEMCSYRCVVGGRTYVGRGGGDGLLLRLRLAKGK